jgi:hypothetical protein
VAFVDDIALQHDLVQAEFGGWRNVPGRHRVASAVPHQRLHDLLAAALVDDLDARGQRRGIPRCETRQGFGTQEMLHRDRLAGTQQRSVEHGVGGGIALGGVAGRQVEAPGFDALLPAGEHERGVDHLGCASASALRAVTK